MNLTQQRYLEAKRIIPGGTQLLSKKPESFAPNRWPGYYTRARGCEVWDLDGAHYYDMTTNGIGACLLGFAYEPVVQAVCERVKNGSMCTQNAPEEVELAERLCQIHPWAEQVRFARGGGEVASVAVRIARATTGRDVVAICGYHGWTDFYIAANLGETSALDGHLLPGLPPAGVPDGLRGTTVTFQYDSIEEFDQVIANYGHRLACVIVETARSTDPAPGFMEHIRAETRRVGALMILDEITVGWRNCLGGYHLKLGITPDMAIFGKALGNGHPVSAVIGTAAAMEGATRSFISSTFWTEAVGSTAALVTLAEMERTRVWEHVWKCGERFTEIMARHAAKSGLPMQTGHSFPTLNHADFTENTLALKTLFTILMLDQGFLAGAAYYPTLAHNDAVLDKYDAACEIVFAQLAEIVKAGDLNNALQDPVCLAGFRRLAK